MIVMNIVEALAACQNERDFYLHSASRAHDEAAKSQAENARLREALKSFEGEYGWTACHDEALSTPTDDTALRQYVAKELRKMGVKLWRRADELENGK